MQQNNTLYKNQSGNVFVVIMIGVFLFGSLIYMFSRSSQQGTGNLTKQQAKIAAQEILNYARLVEGAVDRVRRNGCSETEISFDNAVVAGYSNTNAPVDLSCHIFEDAGGKIEWNDFPQNYNANNYDTDWAYGYMQNRESGNNTHDIVAFVPYIQLEICTELNNYHNHDTIFVDAGDYNINRKYTGSFPANNALRDLVGSFFNKGSFCFQSSSGATIPDPNTYHYVHTLLKR